MTLTEPQPLADRQVGNPLEAMARFIVGSSAGHAPPEVFEAADRGALDMLGCAVLGIREPVMQPLIRYVEETYAAGACTILGAGPGRMPEAAAYANGAAGHVLDFDDCHDALAGHPTVAILPAALALGEMLDASGREVLEAYVTGVEVASVIGRSLHHTHYERGWHPTATLGIFGAAAASARMLGLSVEQTVSALAISASFSSGIKGNFGTFLKPAQVGFAASNGVHAARLAALGVMANPEVFTGGHSYPAVFNSDNDIDWSAVATLGRGDWNMLVPGLVFKLYPCCGSTHAPIDAMLALRAEHGLTADQIESVDIYVHPRRMPHTDRQFPVTSLQAKFSNQYAVAATALHGAPVVSDFDAERVQVPEVQRLLQRTTFQPLTPEEQVILPGRLDCFAAKVAVTTSSGERLEKFLPAMKGSDPANPLATADLEAKFIGNVTESTDADTAKALLASFQSWSAGDRSTVDFMDDFKLATAP